MTTTSDVSAATLTKGTLWALGAGLCWGGAFVAPLVLPGYSALEITAGRFTGSGLFSAAVLVVAVTRAGPSGRVELGQMNIWLVAFALAMIGNFLYFAAMTAGVQRANAPIVTLIIGTLPIAIPLVAQLRDGTFDVRKTALPAALIFAGLMAVHHGAHGEGPTFGLDARYLAGVIFAIVALVAWLIFALANNSAMRRYPHVSAAMWSSIQGVALLPVALPVLALTVFAGTAHADTSRPDIATFLAVSVALGIATSWMALWCWNKATQLLPPALAGQLLVFETIASLTYTYLWFRAWPPMLVVAGAALLIGGVLLGVSRLRK